jgi:hypothetical protein
MKKLDRRTLKRLYREAILQVWTDIDSPEKAIARSVKKDIYYGDEAPGGWSPESCLEIYCENGIPNASDINDFSAEAIEFGLDPQTAISHNSDKWCDIDAVVNLMLEAMGLEDRFHHEPYNNAVINIYRQ